MTLIHRTPSSPKPFRSLAPLAGACLANLWLFACSGDVLNVGENAPPAGSRCRLGAELDGDIVVTNQEQLDALEGCEEIVGDLNVQPFAGADLRPLHALRSVGGQLAFSKARPTEGWGPVGSYCYGNCPLGSEADDLLWLDSLEGLESLEHAGGLNISGTSIRDLDALTQLRSLGNGGFLSLTHCPLLLDVQGLRNLTGIVDFEVSCDSLQSLKALSLPERMGSLNIAGPRLQELGTGAVRAVTNFVQIANTAVENLDELSQLERVGNDLEISGNLELVNIDGLNGLIAAGQLSVGGSPHLERFGELSSLVQLNGLVIGNNDTLWDLSQLEAAHYGRYANYSSYALEPAKAHMPDYVDISVNPMLERFAIPMAWRFSRLVRITGNARMRELDLAQLETIDQLIISNNPVLEQLEHSKLAGVNFLEVSWNPLLDPVELDGLGTVNTTVQGNKGQTGD